MTRDRGREDPSRRGGAESLIPAQPDRRIRMAVVAAKSIFLRFLMIPLA